MASTLGDSLYEDDGGRPPSALPAERTAQVADTRVVIALVGAPAAGKTTFLSALLMGRPEPERYGSWRAIPRDDSALVGVLLDDLMDSRFPAATTHRSLESWTVVGTRPDRTRRHLLGRRKVSAGERVRFTLDILDPPLGDFTDPLRRDLIDVLARAHGIILLIDPTRMLPGGRPGASRYVHRLLAELDNRLLGAGNLHRPPQALTVCVTKLDVLAVYHRAEDLGLLRSAAGGVPHVPSGAPARELFESLCRGSADIADADLPDRLAASFDRIDHHVISAVGLYVDPVRGVFDDRDLVNVVESDGGPRVRRFRPLQVWETLLDLYETLSR